MLALSFRSRTLGSSTRPFNRIGSASGGPKNRFGAYPSVEITPRTYLAKTGYRVTASMLFRKERLGDLGAKVTRQRDLALEEARSKFPEPLANYDQGALSAPDLNDFLVTPQGIKFYYRFGLPHVIALATPREEYLFSWKEMRPFLDEKGPLGHYAKTP
jgi:hypothetical protein